MRVFISASVILFLAVVSGCASGGAVRMETAEQANSCNGETVYSVVLSTRIHQLAGLNPVVGLFYSNDRGETWTQTGWPQGRMFGVMPAPGGCGDTVFTASGNGVFRTTDGGNFWRITTDWRVTEVQDVAINPLRPNQVFASTPYGIVRSDDMGDTWSDSSEGLPSLFVMSVRIDGTNADRMFAGTEAGIAESTDGGRTWEATEIQVPIRSVRQHPEEPSRWVAGLQYEGVALSDDGGRTWRRGSGEISNVTIYAAEFDPQDPSVIYAGGWETGMLISEDFGETWRRSTEGLDHLSIHGIAVLNSEPRTLFAGTMGGGLFRSTDGGASWHASAPEFFAHGQIWDVFAGGDFTMETQSSQSDLGLREDRQTERSEAKSKYALDAGAFSTEKRSSRSSSLTTESRITRHFLSEGPARDAQNRMYRSNHDAERSAFRASMVPWFSRRPSTSTTEHPDTRTREHANTRTREHLDTPQATYNAAFDARADSLNAFMAARALRKLEAGERLGMLDMTLLIRDDLNQAEGNRLIREEVAELRRGGMFFILNIMSAYLHAGDGLEPETRSAIREAMSRLPLYRGDTENHWVMYYTGLYLAAQTWPDEPATSWFNGRSSDENLREAHDYLLRWMEITTTIGQGEFDSPTYFMTFLEPLLLLHTFCEDPELKEFVRKMIDWIVADYAVENLGGLYVGGHSRDYTYDAVAPESAPNVRWGWLLFGDISGIYVDPEFQAEGTAHLDAIHPADAPAYMAFIHPTNENLLAAWADYRVPAIIHEVATDRSEPYLHQERKRVRHVIRYGDEINPPVYKTTYVTPSYALGSLQGGILQPIQQHTWDVTFLHDGPNPTVFTVHPFYSAYELAMFFPEEIEWLADEVDRYHLVYTDPNKWNSSSPYERTFQHENAIIVLYDIEEGTTHPHIDGFFPKSLAERVVDDSGWIFARAGETYMAMYPVQPYEWIEEEVNWRLRSHELRNGIVMEVAESREYDSFEAFIAQIRSNELDLNRFEDDLHIHYTTSRGDDMTFRFPKERILNGTPVVLDEIPLFSGPYLNGDGASRRLEITHGERTYVIDFSDLQTGFERMWNE